MKKVLLLISDNNLFHRQLPKGKQLSIDGYSFHIGNLTHPDDSKEFDYLVIIDNYNKVVEVNCPKNKLVLFTGEPPIVKIYPTKYLEQFGTIFTCQKNILKKNNTYLSMPPLPWMTGCTLKQNTHLYQKDKYMTYEDFQKFENQERLDKICLIISNKKLTKGHRQRVDFALRLKKAMPDKVDIYGNGFLSIQDKFEIQSRYKYSIVIENCSYSDYWTEKLADTYLADSFPIYYGCSNIEHYFSDDEMSIIDIKDFEASIKKIKTILESNIYDKSVNALKRAKGKILNQYNLFSVIAAGLDRVPPAHLEKEIREILYPIHFKINDFIKQKIMRWIYV
jgi:hypothetical protein